MKWTDKEIGILKKYYPMYGATGAKGCIKKLEKNGTIRSRKAVGHKCFKLQLKYIGDKKGAFKKGRIPCNKGKKMPKDLYDKCSKTFFKAGRKPHNTKYNLAVSYLRDNHDVWYWKVRVEEKNWQSLHRIIYENVHNIKLSNNDCVIFIDKDSNNIHPDNLMLVTRSELMELNNPNLHYPKEVVDAIKLNNKIKRKIKNYAKKQNKRPK